MTKLEELKAKLENAIDVVSKTGAFNDESNALRCVNPLIAAAKEEGSAEGVVAGAEQEKERIRKEARALTCDVDGYVILYALVASALEPEREKK